MINSEENEEKLEKELLEEKFDIEACFEEIYKKYKIIFQIIIICLSIFIIAKNFPKKLKNPTITIEPNKSLYPFVKFTPEYETLVNMYISTHKDFKNNVITNQAYKILCDQKSQLKQKYNIEIIETNKDNILYPKNRGYSEGSKIYPIWKQYKEGKISSKYVGLFHYRRVFPFKNDIPNLDEIFQNYDVIVKKRYTHKTTTYEQFNQCHIVHFLNESVDIIKEKYPEYYGDAQKFLSQNWVNFCNIFIAKKEDFIKWGEFVFGVLLELDRRYNLTNDDDIKKLIMKEAKILKKNLNIDYQARLEAFLMERIGNMFYEHHWKKRYEIATVDI